MLYCNNQADILVYILVYHSLIQLIFTRTKELIYSHIAPDYFNLHLSFNMCQQTHVHEKFF
jgi:hypothetical protein